MTAPILASSRHYRLFTRLFCTLLLLGILTGVRVAAAQEQTLLADTASMVKDIHPSAGGSSYPQYFAVWNNTLFFTATDGTSGVELWKSSGTTPGTVLVKDIRPGGLSANVHSLVPSGSQLFFTADNGQHGQELWVTDGTGANTRIVKDINPGSGGSMGSIPQEVEMAALNGKLIFAADDGASGQQLWISDGTSSGTTMLKKINTSGSADIREMTVLNSKVYFTALNSSFLCELWVTDGTASGTKMVKAINPSWGSDPQHLTVSNGRLYFQANANFDTELWVSDGTDAGTKMVKDINPAGSSHPRGLTDVNGTLYFIASDGTYGAELWKSDGTAAGTVMVKDIRSGSQGTFPETGALFDEFINANGTLFFTANNGTTGQELWKSNGTAAGTVMLKDIWPGITSSSPKNLTYYKGQVYFQADDGTLGRELWQSNGTPTGTKMAFHINPLGHADPFGMTEMKGSLYFSASDGTYGKELWRFDSSTIVPLPHRVYLPSLRK